ncbi:hypothetical protein AB0M92_19075 [Streptomyces sp. NPDC051582]|uniref:hypothetical protein n=1 Tax=Streptomyces sp. NPDC051582 TaxID=3155167 RepID=UPI00341C88BD
MTDQPDWYTVDTITGEALAELYARLAQAEQDAEDSIAAAARLTTLVGRRSERAEKAAKAERGRADSAQIELRTLRAGLQANGADPTQLQNLWAQIRLRNRQWREERQRAELAEATIERMKRTNRMVNHGARDARIRAEQAEAALNRVRAAIAQFDGRGVLGDPRCWPLPTAGDVLTAIRTALDPQEPTP